jgi:hypothetical protein
MKHLGMPNPASVLTAAALILCPAAGATEFCAPFSEGAEDLPLIYLDRPDPVITSVIEPVAADMLQDQINGDHPAPLQTVYCDVGMFQMTVRFVQPVEDDAVGAVVTEAVYAWRVDDEPAGWQLSALRRQLLCARGDEPFAALCP